nr:zinc finger, PHD-type [Tanacetum cinerariifolium]
MFHASDQKKKLIQKEDMAKLINDIYRTMMITGARNLVTGNNVSIVYGNDEVPIVVPLKSTMKTVLRVPKQDDESLRRWKEKLPVCNICSSNPVTMTPETTIIQTANRHRRPLNVP